MNVTFFLCLMLFLFISFFFNQTGYAQSVFIDADNLLVRQGPDTAYELIGHVNQGESLPYLDENDEWLAVEYEGQTGWVSKHYAYIVEADNPEKQTSVKQTDDTLEPEPATDSFNIPVVKLHMRAQATTQSDILTVLEQGDIVTVIEAENNEWVKVRWKDLTGFIPAWLLEYTTPIKHEQSSIKDKVIVIDPGHGGHDVGAISITNKFEKDYALFSSRVLKKQLELLGANVYLTREDDFYYALTPRPLLANYLSADAFLSIHYNSEPEHPSANGINTYYLREADQPFADDVHQGMLTNTAARDRGVASADYLVLRVAKQPSLLIELGFLSNATEERTIQSLDYQLKLSQGIIQGLTNYFAN